MVCSMSHSAEELLSIATETRSDFENGVIAPTRLVEVVRAHRPDLVPRQQSLRFKGEESTPEAIQAYLLKCALRTVEDFPYNACDDASAELRERIGYGEIIRGSYGKDDGGHYDRQKRTWVSGYSEDIGDRYHSFLLVGETALGNYTIVDITADQFDGPAIYVGAMTPPWSESCNTGCA
jgi:hypothetical protein